MDDKMLFKVRTKLEKKDYRKFLYLTTFRKSPFTLPLMGVISLIAASAVTYANRPFTISKFLTFFLIMILIAYGVVCLKVEYRSFLVGKNDVSGLFKDHQDITFFENTLMLAKKSAKNKSRVEYDKLFRVLKTNKYLIIYYNTVVASLVRREDLNEETWTGVNELLEKKVGTRFKKF